MQVQDTVRDKLGDMEGKVDALQQSRAETTTALLEQKDSIEQLQAQNETNSDEICNQRGSAGVLNRCRCRWQWVGEGFVVVGTVGGWVEVCQICDVSLFFLF